MTVQAPLKGHELVEDALNIDIPGTITCPSKESMYAMLDEIAEFYGSPVLQKSGNPYTAFKRLIKGNRSRTAKDSNTTHHVITAAPWYGLKRDGTEFYRIRLATAGSYKVAAELTELFNL